MLDDLHVAATNTPRVRDSVRQTPSYGGICSGRVVIVFTSGANGGGQELTPIAAGFCCVTCFTAEKLRSATVEAVALPSPQHRRLRRSRTQTRIRPHRAHRARIALEAGFALLPRLAASWRIDARWCALSAKVRNTK